MTRVPDALHTEVLPAVDAHWQELTVRLNDPMLGPAERSRLRQHLQGLQLRLRAQADSGLPTDTYSQHRAARQAVDAALNILSQVTSGFSDPDAGTTVGPVQSPVFKKR
jgi:hypothetical protein